MGCDGEDCEKSIAVIRGDEVFLRKEPDNSEDSNALKILNENEELLGYVPRYYSEAFTRFINEGREISCYITNVERDNNCSECIMVTVTLK